MLRVLDLFSGIGGFSLGLERTGGFKTVAFCEIDPFCRRVLAKHWQDVPCSPDIRERKFIEGEADVITGGFPCQDISYAGAGAGLAGERSGLWRELVRAIRLVRPKHAFVENVAALLGRGMGDVLGDLAEIGYDAEWHCIPASAVGAPHRRDRLWIIADPGSQQHEGDRAPYSGTLAQELLRAAAYANREGEHDGAVNAEIGGAQELVADAPRDGRRSRRTRDAAQEPRGRKPSGSGKRADLRNANVSGLAFPERQSRDVGEKFTSALGADWWSIEPAVGRVAHGVPSRVDRLRSLGNAVVPQIPELIGRAVLAASGIKAASRGFGTEGSET